jgi:plasmid stabilization system protein ParE
MPSVHWTNGAKRALNTVRSEHDFEGILDATARLGRFPELGRRIPDIKSKAEYSILREVIVPLRARIFYVHILESDEVLILGICHAGQRFRRSMLGHRFS